MGKKNQYHKEFAEPGAGELLQMYCESKFLDLSLPAPYMHSARLGKAGNFPVSVPLSLKQLAVISIIGCFQRTNSVR